MSEPAPLSPPPSSKSGQPEPVHGTASSTRRVWRAVLRVLLAVLLGILLGIGLYYGGLYAYQRQSQPQKALLERLAKVETLQSNYAGQVQSLAGQLQTRVVGLQAQHDQQATAVADLRGSLDDAEQAIQTHSAALDRLDGLQAELANLNRLVGQNSQSVGQLNQQVSDTLATLTDLEQQVRLFKTMELLSRARLYLTQSNLGLARQDLQAARNALNGMPADVPELAGVTPQALASRLDQALADLPLYPVLALNELDGVWETLVVGLPQGGSAAGSAPTSCSGAACPGAAPTSTPNPTLTPSPRPT
jgi:hypothetical protein